MAEKSALLPPSIDEKRSYDIDETVSAPHRPSTRFITLVLFLAIWTICSDITARHAPLNVWKPCGWSKTIVLPSLEEQKATEKAFLRVPTPESILEVSRNYTSYVHLAGTKEDRDSAAVVRDQWSELLNLEKATKRDDGFFDAGSRQSIKHLTERGQGDRVWVDTYYSLLNYPTGKSKVELRTREGRSLFNATLAEDDLDEDSTSKEGNKGVPPFHGFSKAGSAKGQVVYANLGRIEDYQELKRREISLKGKIVLVRYGGVFRGLKVSLAEEAGAVGVLIYSDPFEDGEITIDNGYAPYPHGPARQPSSIQRGSVQALSKYPGDPLTPGKPSYKDAKRLSRNAKGLSVPGIPSLPISYKDALPLLKSLENHGDRVGEEWEGALPGIHYFTGPSEDILHMHNAVKESIKPIWNVYALIEGEIDDEVVVLGNHRDAWVFGAGDPSSGTSSVHDIVKGFGKLRKEGWKPARSILIASWDAEEYGLIGSTEFGEDFPDWIQRHVVAYLNVDISSVGSILEMRASPLLSHLLAGAAQEIGTVAGDKAHNYTAEDVGDLGSGSGAMPRLGIASTDASYKRGKLDPVYHYHSVFDSQYWQEDFGDVGFVHHTQLAKILGLTALRLADASLLPLNATSYATSLLRYTSHVRSALAASALPEDSIDLFPLDCAVARISNAAAHFDIRVHDALAPVEGDDRRRRRVYDVQLIRFNSALRGVEKAFLDNKGLKGREWYRHLGIAPGRWLGYGATPFPGVTEAIALEEDAKAANKEIERLVKRLDRISEILRHA